MPLLIQIYAVAVKIWQLIDECQSERFRIPPLLRLALELREALKRFFPLPSSEDDELIWDLFRPVLRTIQRLPNPPDNHLFEVNQALHRCAEQLGLLDQQIRSRLQDIHSGEQLRRWYRIGCDVLDQDKSFEELRESIRAAGGNPTALLPQLPENVLDRIGESKHCPERWVFVDAGVEHCMAADEHPGPLPPVVELNDLEAIIHRIVSEAGHRIVGREILDALTDEGIRPAESQFKATMAAMVRHGIFSNRRGTNGGYGLPDWP